MPRVGIAYHTIPSPPPNLVVVVTPKDEILRFNGSIVRGLIACIIGVRGSLTRRSLRCGNSVPSRTNEAKRGTMVDATTTTTSVTARSSNHEDKKIQEIEDLLLNPDGIDLWRLREACLTEGGLMHGKLLLLFTVVMVVKLRCCDMTFATSHFHPLILPF